MQRAAIERLLPAVYQRAAGPGGVLRAVLDAMETLHAPTEAALTAVEDLFHPYRTPKRLVPFLARWVALDHVLPVPRLRDLVASGAQIAQHRGTAAGLRALLEKATGVPGFAIDEPADRPFHIVVRVPPAATDQIETVRRIVAMEKPAATTSEVVPAQPTTHREETEQ